LRTPDEVLNRLDDIISEKQPIRVHGANRFSVKVGDWRRIELGKNVFVHRDVPQGWLEEWAAFVASGHPIGLMTARTCLAPFTWTQLSRLLDPVGIDRWFFELALKHGMRDGFTCPVGGRWVVAFWSRKELSNLMTKPMRIIVYAAASFAALRLEQLADLDPNMVGSRARLTPRELAVLRLLSTGAQFREAAQALDLGEETVRSHLKKAQTKLGVRNRTQAVAEALRQRLIP